MEHRAVRRMSPRLGLLPLIAALVVTSLSVACLPGGLVPPTPTDAPPIVLVPTSTAAAAFPGTPPTRLVVATPLLAVTTSPVAVANTVQSNLGNAPTVTIYTPRPVQAIPAPTNATLNPTPTIRPETRTRVTVRGSALASPSPTSSPTRVPNTSTATSTREPSATPAPSPRAPGTPNPANGYPLPSSAPVLTPAPAAGYPSPTR